MTHNENRIKTNQDADTVDSEPREQEPLGSFLTFSERQLQKKDSLRGVEDEQFLRYARYTGNEIPESLDHKGNIERQAIKPNDIVIVCDSSIEAPRKREATIKAGDDWHTVDPGNIKRTQQGRGGYSQTATYIGPDTGDRPSNSRMFIGWTRLQPGDEVKVIKYEEGHPGTAAIVKLGDAELNMGRATVNLEQLQRLRPAEILTILDEKKTKEQEKFKERRKKSLKPETKQARNQALEILATNPDQIVDFLENANKNLGVREHELRDAVAEYLCSHIDTPVFLERFFVFIDMLAIYQQYSETEVQVVIKYNFIPQAALLLERPDFEQALEKLGTVYTKQLSTESEEWEIKKANTRQQELTKAIDKGIDDFVANSDISNIHYIVPIDALRKTFLIAMERGSTAKRTIDLAMKYIRYRIEAIKKEAEVRYAVAHALDDYDSNGYAKTQAYMEEQAKPWQELHDEITAASGARRWH